MAPAAPPGIFPKGDKVAGRLRGAGYQPKASNKQTNKHWASVKLRANDPAMGGDQTCIFFQEVELFSNRLICTFDILPQSEKNPNYPDPPHKCFLLHF